MRLTLAGIFIVTISTLNYNCLFSQGLNELDKRNGFQSIKLGTKVDSYYFIKCDVGLSGICRVDANDFAFKINGKKVEDIDVSVKNGYIVSILVFVRDPEFGFENFLINTYGPPTIKGEKSYCKWIGKRVSLTMESYEGIGSNRGIELMYSLYNASTNFDKLPSSDF